MSSKSTALKKKDKCKELKSVLQLLLRIALLKGGDDEETRLAKERKGKGEKQHRGGRFFMFSESDVWLGVTGGGLFKGTPPMVSLLALRA